MSVLGVDLGTSAVVMASIRSGKLMVLRNEISERATPAIVSYTGTGERIVGDVALNAINSNFRTTCRNMKSVLGRRATPDFLEQQKNYCLAPINNGGDIGHVHYALSTTEQSISCIQAMASLLLSLVETAKKALDAPAIGGAVLSVPSYYTETRIGHLKVAAEIAKIHVLECVKEYMAVAMDYGIYRRKNFDEKIPTVTAFVSVGHGYSYVTIAEFTQHYGKVLSTANNDDLGSRKLDDILIDRMAQKFKKETGLDASSNARARLKLETAAGKVKKTLSSNKEATFGMECLMEGEDLNGVIKQDDLFTDAVPLAGSLTMLCRQALDLLPPGCIVTSVELIGNGTRSPLFIRAIEEAFQIPGQRTLSADETVSRGCALYAAVFSPTVRVKEYPIFDWMNPVPNKLRNPAPPKPKNEGFLKGFLSGGKKDTPPADAPSADTSAPEATTPEGGPTHNIEEASPGSDVPTESVLEGTEEAESQPPVEDIEEDLTPLPNLPEDPNMVADPVNPGMVRAYQEMEIVQAKKDKEARLRRDAINSYESTIFFCRDRCRSAWKAESNDDIVKQVDNYLNTSEEWLWDNMDEKFGVYEDRIDDLKHFVGQWFNDFKPKPPSPPAEPIVEEPTVEEPAVATETAPEGDAPVDTESKEPSKVTEA